MSRLDTYGTQAIDWARARRGLHLRAEAIRAKLAATPDGPRFVAVQVGAEGKTVEVFTSRGAIIAELGDALATARALRDLAHPRGKRRGAA